MTERPTEEDMDNIYSNLTNMREYLHKRYPHTWSDMFSEFDIKYSQYLQRTKYQTIYDFCKETDYEEVLNEICDREFIEEQRLENKKEEARIKMCAVHEDFSSDCEEDSFVNKLMNM